MNTAGIAKWGAVTSGLCLVYFSAMARADRLAEESVPPDQPTSDVSDCYANASASTALADVPVDQTRDVSDCYGYGQMSLIINGYYCLSGDTEWAGVTVMPGAELDLCGHTLRVSGTVLNRGTITDSRCGGSGGSRGLGGDGGQGSVVHQPPGTCTPGGDGGDAVCTPGGKGGPGGGGGGGGGGAWNICPGCWVEGDTPGGDGGDGGAGGRGGGYVKLFVYNLDNQGVIEVDGQAGQDGMGGGDGQYDEYRCELLMTDAASGGGGGGGGGDGGDGGTIEIHYAHLVHMGAIHANGGAGGDGGEAGTSHCDELVWPARTLCQRWEYGSPGCSPGDTGCGWGGRGGASDIGTGCDPAYALPGQPGCNGDPGTVILLRDCNCNEIADAGDIASGVSADCQPNAVPDECDIDSGASDDCDVDLVPDECQPSSPDCDADGVPDRCELLFVACSDRFTPIGAGSPQCYEIADPPDAVGDVSLLFRAVGDLDSAGEYIDVDINGWPVGRVFAAGASQCPKLRDVDSLPPLSAAFWNAVVSGGDATICMTASSAVDPDLCTPSSYVQLCVSYPTDERDCNANGIPDDCDIAAGTSQDCQPNGIPDECEWACDPPSTAECPDADVNCDGIADGFDIAVIRNGSNWLKDVCDSEVMRCDVNRDGLVDGFDIAAIRRGDCWLR